MSSSAARRADYKEKIMQMHRLVGSKLLLNNMNRVQMQEKRDLLENLMHQFKRENDNLFKLLSIDEKAKLVISANEMDAIYTFIRRALHKQMEKLGRQADENVVARIQRVPIRPSDVLVQPLDSNGRNSIANRIKPIAGPSGDQFRGPIQVGRLKSTVRQVGPNDLRLKLNRVRNNGECDLRSQLNGEWKKVAGSINPKVSCFNCGGDHPIHKCPQFVNMKITGTMDRFNLLGLCNNCLSMYTGKIHTCKHKNCHRCGDKVFHNSLICPRNPANRHRL